MIYTITLSPAIDYFINTNDKITPDTINRAASTSYRVGGKGLNVSTILNTLEIKSMAVVLLGGFSGGYIEDQINTMEHCLIDKIEVDENTRINVKIDDGSLKYSINGPGPSVTKEIKDALIEKMNQVQEGDYVMLCGSRVEGIDDAWLIELAGAIHNKKAKLVLDMEQVDLVLLEKMKPFLIKPNLHELKILLGLAISEDIDIDESISKLLSIGVESVLLSMGSDGALYATSNGKHSINQTVTYDENDVGMGDAMLGAFVGKLSQGKDISDSLLFGAASGSATASTKSRIDLNDIISETKNIIIKSL